MRFRSSKSNTFQVFAVAGVNTVSFGIVAGKSAKKGLLGFAVERYDPALNERYIMPGFKVFRSVIPNPIPDASVSTWEHPVQSFVWDDFTARPDHKYEYKFFPIKGTPKNLDRTTKPVTIKVQTEPLFSKEMHDVFFNRGVASSQAYNRRFGNQSPRKIAEKDPKKAKEAIQWLTRELDDAALRFITNAKKGDTLLGCFYEFRYEPVAAELRKAVDRGVNVRLIIDAKVNEKKNKAGKVIEKSFPREENLEMLKAVGFKKKNYILREAKPNNIQHNKFMVLVKKGSTPTEVWTGSTNISEGGFSGQTNVGHWVRNPDVAKKFESYWQLLKKDPGATAGQSRSDALQANDDFRKDVAKLDMTPTEFAKINPGTTAVFSPRPGLKVLEMYIALVDGASRCSCITLAFGINKSFKDALVNNTNLTPLIFMLLEKRDLPNPKAKDPFVPLGARQNIYQAWGAFLEDPVYQWARETNARLLGFNKHVTYIHSKFLLMDPLGAEPLVVTGSANFSKASTNDNDENMLIVRGDKRVADIYFTEFNRLFNHYYFRSITEALSELPSAKSSADSLFLVESDKWIEKYKPGKLKAKRLQLYADMDV